MLARLPRALALLALLELCAGFASTGAMRSLSPVGRRTSKVAPRGVPRRDGLKQRAGKLSSTALEKGGNRRPYDFDDDFDEQQPQYPPQYPPYPPQYAPDPNQYPPQYAPDPRAYPPPYPPQYAPYPPQYPPQMNPYAEPQPGQMQPYYGQPYGQPPPQVAPKQPAKQSEDCDIAHPAHCEGEQNPLMQKLNEWQEAGVGGAVLLLATAVSLGLANFGPTAGKWLNFWSVPKAVSIAGHALSLKDWVNEGLMAIFFTVVGLEIKHELRHGSLKSPRKAILPCIAAIGGMVTPMAIYAGINLCKAGRLAGGSLAAMAVPMATDIAFALAIYSLFSKNMPASASAFLLTLATVDDLGAIAVLATCYAKHVSAAFLGVAGALTAALAFVGNWQASSKRNADAKIFAVGGVALWWALMKAGVSADIAGVVVGLCISTRAMYNGEAFAHRLVGKLSPLATFLIMPVFALANTAVPVGQAFGTVASKAAMPALGIAGGLLIGKPIGIFGFTWLAEKFGVASLPEGMNNRSLFAVSLLGAIGFTMCLLLTDVSMSAPLAPLPKLSVLVASGIASVGAALMMKFGMGTGAPAVKLPAGFTPSNSAEAYLASLSMK